MNYIITKRIPYFQEIGKYNYCDLTDLELPDKISLDSETSGLKWFKSDMFCIQIGTGNNNYIIDLETINFQEVIPYIEHKYLVFHNAIFDLTFFYKHNFFPWRVRDTFLARKILHNGKAYKRHDFGTMMEEELGLIYDKSEQKNIAKIKLSTDKAIQYAFNDVDKLLEVEKKLNQQIYDGGYVQTYNLHCKWIRAAAYMTCSGVPINETKWKEKCVNDKKELEIKEKLVSDYILQQFPKYQKAQLSLFDDDPGIDVLLSSPNQMIKVFEDFGIDCTDEEKKIGKSIAENIINREKGKLKTQNNEKALKFIEYWLDYQSIKHDVTTFGENFFPSIWNGRLYTTYKPILDTARISAGGKNKVKGEVNDVNTLNIPANQKSREPFEAKDGFDYLVSDFEGQTGMIFVYKNT